MKTFHHSVSTRVICSGEYVLDSKEVGKSGKERLQIVHRDQWLL